MFSLKATQDVLYQARFVLDVTVQVLPIYEQMFNIEYPLPKLDTLIVSSSSLPDSNLLD